MRMKRMQFIAGTGLAVLCLAHNTFAINGTLVKAADGKRMNGDIRYQPASKQYIITANGVSMTLAANQVKEVMVPKPAGFDAAVRAVQSKQYAAALPKLEEIMNKYKMMQWDVPATRYAAEAQLGMGEAGKAVMLCETLIRDNPAAQYTGEIASIYWQALVESGKTATLRKILESAAKGGDRQLAALAQLRRGDIDMKAGNYKEALVDGYLRTYVFFKQEAQYVPEALYKASQCFEQINESANAEKMRKKLLAEFPDSAYSQKVRSGQ